MIAKKIVLLPALVLLLAHVFAQDAAIPKASRYLSQGSKLLDVNYAALVARADLHYDTPVVQSEEGQPIGNGRMGSLVWTIPSGIQLQVNRVDVFGNNSASNNFYERNTDYCGGTGQVHIDFGEGVFATSDFQQHLSCYDGTVALKGKDVQAQVWTWNEKDVMMVHINDERHRTWHYPVRINCSMLRLPVTRRGNHTAVSTLQQVGNYMVLKQEFKEDNYYCASALVIGTNTGTIYTEMVSETTMRLAKAGFSTDYTIYIGSAASFDPKEDVVQKAIDQVNAAKQQTYTSLWQNNRQWWQQFWQKAFVQMHSADGEADFVEKHYTYYLYVMASSSRGDYPTKFNGMLWTTGGDARKWGALFWGANQSCLYNALFPANRPELLKPMFKMYSAAYDTYATAAVQQWGSKGIYIPETTCFDGMAPLPESIAAEMRDLYIRKKDWRNKSNEFVQYANTKLPFLSRWNWKKDSGWVAGHWLTADKGGGPYGHVTHIFSRGAKIAYQYWLQYEYNQDTQWLRQYAYPILKGVAEFYRNYPGIKKEADGKYHIYDVNDNESIWGGHNTVEEISSMMGIFPVAIKAAAILKTDETLRAQWQSFLSQLSPLTVTERRVGDRGLKTWAGSLPPVVQGSVNRLPDGNTMPVWFFDLCTLETKDSAQMRIANNTFDSYFLQRGGGSIDTGTRVNVLSKLAVAGVQLGRVEATRYLIPNQIRTKEIPPLINRMDLREGFQTTSVQRLGRAAEALHYALCQSIPAEPGAAPVIHVFPAWPTNWDAAFTLLCRGGFLVSASITKGTIDLVEIEAPHGGTCRIKNPWPGKQVAIYINNRKTRPTKADRLTIHTGANNHIVLLPEGNSLANARKKIL
jgi:hypothetical protein